MSLTSYRAAPPRVRTALSGGLRFATHCFGGVTEDCGLQAQPTLRFFHLVGGFEDLAATYSPVP